MAYVEEHLGELAKGSVSAISPATYVGGDCRVPSDPGQVHVAIGLKGVDCSDKEVVAAAVLQSLLGGGDQFSAGGPGKGLTSRIFRNVLSNPEVLTATSFNVSYQVMLQFVAVCVAVCYVAHFPQRLFNHEVLTASCRIR